MAKVWELRTSSTQTLILVALADHAQDDGTGAYPSLQRLAYKTNLAYRTVQRQMRELQNEGLIEVVGNWDGGRGRVRQYVLHPEKGVRKPPFEEWIKGDTETPLSDAERVTERHPIESLKGDTESVKRVTLCRQKGDTESVPLKDLTVSEPSEEPKTTRAREKRFVGPESEPARGVAFAFLKSLGAEPGSIPESYLGKQCRAAAALLNEGYGPDDILGCARFMSSQTWRTNPFDLGDVRSQVGKWIANGRPERERTQTSEAGGDIDRLYPDLQIPEWKARASGE